VDTSPLQPRRHEPPPGWDRETFETVTDALARALVAAVRRQAEALENVAVRELA
jgi:hypothetical protein